jgi:hypothetical protein
MPSRHWSRGLNWIVVSNIVQWRRIGRRVGTAGLPEDGVRLRAPFDEAVGSLQQIGGSWRPGEARAVPMGM